MDAQKRPGGGGMSAGGGIGGGIRGGGSGGGARGGNSGEAGRPARWPVAGPLTLLGMPGAGKSTVARVLAERFGVPIFDGDVEIERRSGRHHSELLAELGREGFLDHEAEVLRSVAPEPMVVAPGGSVVYRERAVEHLRRLGPVIYLYVPEEVLAGRVGPLGPRGVVLGPGQTFGDLFRERDPMYASAAHAAVRSGEEPPEATAERVIRAAAELSPNG